LKKSLDAVYHDFCIQLSGNKKMARKSLQDLVHYNKQIDSLEKEITQLKKSIKNSKQYKCKVEHNLLLKQRVQELKTLIS
jgi:flagellar biosynthesis chaperone FliJ